VSEIYLDVRASDVIGSKEGHSAVTSAAEWLSLAAAPTFAIMALMTRIHGGGMPELLCWAMHGTSPLTGMASMYLLMSAFHLTPWLRLIPRWRRGTQVSSPGTPMSERCAAR
jgi:hypothetical protein